MRLLPLLGLAALAAGTATAQSAPKVRPIWWQSPAQPIPLYAEGVGGKPQPIRVLPMCVLESFKADPVKGAVLLRREEPDPADPAGKPRWVPFVTTPVPAGAGEILMVLQAGADGKTGQARVVPMDAESLPWGGTRLINFTPDRLIGLVDGKRFAVEPGDSAVLPFVAAKRSVVDVLIGRESRGEQALVFSSKGIFTPAKRTLLFVLRTPSGSHETRAIEEPNPDPTAETGPAPAPPTGAPRPANGPRPAGK
jgi:hypothetical protein